MEDPSGSKRISPALPTSERGEPAVLEGSKIPDLITFEGSVDCIALLDLEGRLLFLNDPAAKALASRGERQLLGQLWTDCLVPEIAGVAAQAVARSRRGEVCRFTAAHAFAAASARCWDITISPVPGETSAPAALLVTSRDISGRAFGEERMRWVANHDQLTHLPNRVAFQARLDELTAPSTRAGAPFGLLLLDIDGFKRINDTFGHSAGDTLLRLFAERLLASTSGEDFVARIGGDEFAVILPAVETDQELQIAVDAILDALRAPCVHDGQALDCRASIGGSLYPIMGSSRAELLKNTDVALHAAKRAGRGTMRTFEPSMRSEIQKRHSMLALAKNAIERRRILPYYQPKLDLRTARLAGFEALLRWNHPQRGVQPPSTIAAAFEDLVLAAEISDHMIAGVLADLREWLAAGLEFQHVAINAAAAEFRRGGFAERLLGQLRAADVPAKCLQLEVTESVFLGSGAECVEQALKTLRAAGLKIALDDFGTGFASLSHLKRFPVDIIKIDQSFIRDLHEDPEDEAIVRAVIGLGKSLNIKVVAEGIETPAQSAYLRKYDCEYGQGYLFSAAQPAPAVPALIRAIDAKAEHLRTRQLDELLHARQPNLGSSEQRKRT